MSGDIPLGSEGERKTPNGGYPIVDHSTCLNRSGTTYIPQSGDPLLLMIPESTAAAARCDDPLVRRRHDPLIR
jgi:hypothetical protein